MRRFSGIAYPARIWPRLFWGCVLGYATVVTYHGTHPTHYYLMAIWILLSAYAFITAGRVAWKKRRVAWP